MYQLSSCWLGCRLKRRAAELAVKANLVQEVKIELVRRYIMILCESDWCIQATSTSVLQDLRSSISNVVFFAPDLLYSVIGLIVESLLILACIAVGFLIVVVWRVTRDALVYLVLVSLLFLAEILLLVWWATTIQTAFLPEVVVSTLNQLSEGIYIIFFVVVVVMSLNWVFALVELLGKETISSRTEIVIRISVLTFAGLFGVCVITLSLTTQATATESQLNALLAFLTILRMSSVVLCLFMLVCSVIGYVVLKRDARSSQQSVTGLLKMMLVSIVFAITACFQFAFFCIEHVGFLSSGARGNYYVPPWFEYGLVVILSHLVLISALLYLIAKASEGFVRKRPQSSVELLNKSLLSKEERIPKAYDI
jgi:hypothetical protein